MPSLKTEAAQLQDPSIPGIHCSQIPRSACDHRVGPGALEYCMWGGDVTAAGYSGAPLHNTHTVTTVKIHSRRREVVVEEKEEGPCAGESLLGSLAAKINAEPCAHGADTVAGVCNRHAHRPNVQRKYS